MSKNARRIGAIAGLALLPAIAFGGTAAAATDGQPANGNQSQTQQVESSAQKKIKVEGEVSNIEKRGDVEWGEVTVISVAAYPGGPELEFVLTPDTTISLGDGKPEVGDKVTAAGEVQQDGKTVLADHMAFH
ncbi:hypothetical protein [Prauserella cavernicola]|uniref:DUF5666 domain-containing protein n=1 Tax=Prauserella cavernicola TaxID=2800127 RepID=A0A934QTR5_9PSEU|nr:hypothetical protein [Prauserella cavernicola]MBK1786350.1 hypothetical protein [Prauserella cavernicola]